MTATVRICCSKITFSFSVPKDHWGVSFALKAEQLLESCSTPTMPVDHRLAPMQSYYTLQSGKRSYNRIQIKILSNKLKDL